MTKMITRRAAQALLAGAAFALALPASAQSEETLRVRLDWTPWGVHAALHLAQEKGWYKAAGLNVQMEDGNGSVTTVQIVGSTDRFDVGHASLATMMIAREKGLPVKALATFARLSDIGLLVPKESGIKGPADLRGKRIAYTAGSLEAPFIDTFLAAGKLKRSDVELVNVEAAAKASTYAVGRTDAVFSTIPFFLPAMEKSRPSNAIRFADYKLNSPSFGLFTSEQKIAERPEALARFATVVAQTWAYIYRGNQDEAVRAIIAQRPQAKLDPVILRGQIDALQSFFQSPAAAGQPIGLPVLGDWQEAVATLGEAGLVAKDRNPADYFVPGFVRTTPIAGIPR